MNDVVGRLHVHPKPDGDGRQDDDCETRLLLELVDQPLAAIRALTAGTGITVNDGSAKPEMLLNRVLQLSLNITQLGKDNDLVAVPGSFDRLKRLHQPLQLRRVVAQSLVRLNTVRMGANEL
ncbi:hypothetical protein D3C86_1801600 [compost metagenome]